MNRNLSVVSLIFILLVISSGAFAHTLNVWTTLGTSKYLQDELPSASVPVSLDSGRNEHEGFQVILCSKSSISSASVLVTDLKSGKNVIQSSNIELRMAHYIEVKQSLNGKSRAGFYPDALLPMPASFSLKSGKGQMIWANVYVPKNAKPGIYKGVLTVKAGSEVKKVQIKLRVRDFELSVENHFGSAFAVWWDQAANYYNLESSSPEFKAMSERYYWFLTGYRLPPDDIPVPVDSPDAAKYLNDSRVTSFRIPYDFKDPETFKNRAEILRKNGWLSKGYVYTIDEPDEVALKKCVAYAKELHSIAPDVKWLLTTSPSNLLIGDVNIWSPILSAFNEKECAERQMAGDSVWWYTCVNPPYPYPTYFIDDYAIAPRVLSWYQARYNVEGVLYWAMNIWSKWDGNKYLARNVWSDPLAFPGANGDGYLIYPGKTPKDDPIPSLRLEMIRKGNEDFETLYILKNRYMNVAKALGLSIADYDPQSRVIDYAGRLGRSLTNWNSSAKLLEGVRSDLMDDIESVEVGPRVIVSTSINEGVYKKPQSVGLKIWAEKGSSIKVVLTSRGRIVKIPVDSKRTYYSGCSLSTCSIPISSGSASIKIFASKNGKTKEIKRVYRIESAYKIDMKNSTVFCNWDSPDIFKNMENYSVDISLENISELGKCAKVTYKANVDFPHIQFFFPEGKNCKLDKSIDFSFYNPNKELAILCAKIADLDGNVLDATIVPLESETSVYRWPISKIKKKINVERVRSIELWMWRRLKPVTIYVGACATSKDKLN